MLLACVCLGLLLSSYQAQWRIKGVGAITQFRSFPRSDSSPKDAHGIFTYGQGTRDKGEHHAFFIEQKQMRIQGTL